MSKAWQKVTAAYCWVYDKYHLHADCLEIGINSVPNPTLDLHDSGISGSRTCDVNNNTDT